MSGLPTIFKSYRGCKFKGKSVFADLETPYYHRPLPTSALSSRFSALYDASSVSPEEAL